MDAVDHRILRELAQDARLTMADLGRRVGLSRTATLARVRRLEAGGAIRGYHADIATATPPAGHAARGGIAIRAADTAGYVVKLAAFPEFRGAEAVAGEWDLLVAVEAPTAERLDEVLDAIGAWPQTVRTQTFVVLRRYPPPTTASR